MKIYSLNTRSIPINFGSIKKSIDANRPVILSTSFPWNHLFVAKGYTTDGKIIVNDSFKNHQDNTWLGSPSPINYSLNGESAIYDLNYKPNGNPQGIVWVGAQEIY